jgi:hypothetical protein
MRTIWHSLAWKEWHEHKWKLVLLVTILWSIVVIALLDLDRGSLVGIFVGLFLGIAPLAVFIGLSSAASERSRGTLPFLQALPVPMWRVALHKIAMGLITILVPVALTVALVLVWLGCLDLLGIEYRAADDFAEFGSLDFRFFDNARANWAARAVFVSAIVGTSFYVWTIATSVNRKDEVSAGAVALAAIVGWWWLLACASKVLAAFGWINRAEPSWIEVVGLATAPGGLIPVVDDPTFRGVQLRAVGLALATVTHVALAAWYVMRFARISDLEIRSPKTAVRGTGLDWLGAPRRSPLAAIAWKQVRESGPLALVGLAVIAATAVVLWMGIERSSRHVVSIYALASATVGWSFAIIGGIGAFFYDVRPRLNEFWRSRPINPDLWFWSKFLSGLTIVLAAIYGPIVLIVLSHIIALIVSPDFELPLLINRLAVSYEPALLLFPVITIALFAAAAAMICLVRNAVYAAILCIAVVSFGFVATAISIAVVQLLRGEEGPKYLYEVFDDVTPLQGAAGFSLTCILCTILAWLAVRHDWGKKSRY